MKKYTQTEFDAIPRDERGIKNCPTGDYTEIKSFPENCSFGKFCSFGKWCRFGKWCSFGKCCRFDESCRFGTDCSFGESCKFGINCSCEFGVFKDMVTIGGFGSEGRITYFFLLKDNTVGVRCGCFSGTLDKWKNKVKKTHGNTDIAKEYLLAAKLIEMRFKRVE